MRTPILAALLGLTLTGCLIGDSGSSGTGAGDDDGSNDGSNGGSNGGSNTGGTPAAAATVDRSTVATELGKTETITVTVKSTGGFTGDVTLTPTVTDAAGTALTDGITVTGDPKVTLTANGTSTVAYMVNIPTDASGADLAATLKVHASSSAGEQDVTSTINVAAILTLTYAAGTAADSAKHPYAGQEIKVKAGTKVHLHNADTVSHITHGGQVNGAGGWPHETQNAAVGGIPNGTYEILTAGKPVGYSGIIGCHSHPGTADATYHQLTID